MLKTESEEATSHTDDSFKQITDLIKNNENNSSVQKRQNELLSSCSFFTACYVLFVGILIMIGLIVVIIKAPDLTSELPFIPIDKTIVSNDLERKCQLSFTLLPEYPINFNTRPVAIATGDFNNDSRLDLVVVFKALDTFKVLFGVGDGNFTTDDRHYFTVSHASLSSIAVGDINDDQSLDLVLTYSGINQIGIFLGSSNGSFHQWTTIGTGNGRPVWVTIADFNNDQYKDIGIVNHGYDSIILLYGNGSGYFETRLTHWTGFDSMPSAIIAADMNADGQTDIVIANTGTNNIAVLFRNHNSTLQDPVIYSTGFDSKPYSLVAGYFNDDPFLDLAVANQGSQDIVILLGSVDGTLHEHQRYSLGNNSPYMILLADFNKDAISDLVVSNVGEQSVGFLSGHSNGTFDEPFMYTTNSRSKLSMAIGDFNHDDQLDLISVSYDTNNLEVLFWGYRLFQGQTTYSTGFRPSSIVVADLNRDKFQDIIVANSGDNTISLFSGDGKGNFSMRETISIGDPLAMMAIADLNHDDHLDIVVTNHLDFSLTLLFGESFEEKRLIHLLMQPWDIVLEDFDGDTNLDILILSSSDERIGLLLGLGDGNFSEILIVNTTSIPLRAKSGDLNNDNIIDLVVVYETTIMDVFLGNGDGTFMTPVMYDTGSYPNTLAIADLNLDNRLDVFLLSRSDHTVSLYFGKGDGSLIKHMKMSTLYRPTFLVTADFNNDGKTDIIIAYVTANKIGAMLGHGNGTFGNQTIYATGSGPSSMATGDFDGNGKIDVAVIHYGSNIINVFIQNMSVNFTDIKSLAFDTSSGLNTMMIRDLDNDGFPDILTTMYGTKTIGISFGLVDGRFSQVQTYTTGSGFRWTTIGDFNGDQHLDFAATDMDKRIISLFVATSNRTFEFQVSRTSEFSFPPLIIGAGDFDHDAKSEIVATIDKSNQIDVFVSYDAGNFKLENAYSTGASPSYLVTALLNNDTIVDIVTLSYKNNQISIYLGLGDGSFGNPTTYDTGLRPHSAVLVDFNDDQIIDIVVINEGNNTIVVFHGVGDGTFEEQQSYVVGSNCRGADVGDFNEDNILDLIVVNVESNYTSLIFGNGDGTFQNQTKLWTVRSLSWIAVGYIDQDDHLDFVVSNYELNQIIIFLGDGDGQFQQTMVYETNLRPIHLTLRDLDNDAHLDVVVVCYNAQEINIYFGHGDGTFSSPKILSTGVFPVHSVVTDINHDNKLDVLVTNQGDNVINVFLNHGNRSFVLSGSHQVGPRPGIFAVADFNRDARLDIAVTNFWDAKFEILIGYPDYSLFRATSISVSEHIQPEALAVADLNNDNETDIIVVDRYSDMIIIFFGHGNLTFSDPYEFPSGSSSIVSLATGDFNQDDLVDVVAVQKNTHQIVIFLSTSNGSLRVGSTYSTGAESYPNHASVSYINNDLNLDIVVSNSGRNNIGVFIGLGNGSFEAMIPVAIPYGSSPFAVGIGDFDQDQKMDLAVANRDADNINILLQSCLNV